MAIFDFDGTIADSLGEVLHAYNTVALRLDVPTVSDERLEQLRKLTPREVLAEMAVPMWKIPRVVSAVRVHLRERMHLLAPFPGMTDALSTLRAAGLSMCIASSNSRENIDAFLERHPLEGLAVSSHGASLFGKASRLRKLARRSEFRGAQLFYVGDEVRDVLAANEAGLRSVAVSWGYSDRAALAAAQPAFLVDTPDELAALLCSHD